MLEVRKITTRETHNGQPFHPGDYLIHIGRYFDRDATDTSGLTFEEWQPELVFSSADVGSALTISAKGHVSRLAASAKARSSVLECRRAAISTLQQDHCLRQR